MAYRDLIDEETGSVDVIAYRRMIRNRCIRDYGVVTPRGVRSATSFLRPILNGLRDDWKMRHGLSVAMSDMSADLSGDLQGVQKEL